MSSIDNLNQNQIENSSSSSSSSSDMSVQSNANNNNSNSNINGNNNNNPNNGNNDNSKCKLFVGNLSSTWNESHLKNVFEPYGEIQEAVILKDRTTGVSKNCGFIVFANILSALNAVNALNNVTLPELNKPLIVRIAGTRPSPEEEHKLFVSNLSRSTGAAELRRIFAVYGTIVDSHILTTADGGSKGQAFVKFASIEAASKAINELNAKYVDGDAIGPIEVRFAEHKQERDQRREINHMKFRQVNGGFQQYHHHHHHHHHQHQLHQFDNRGLVNDRYHAHHHHHHHHQGHPQHQHQHVQHQHGHQHQGHQHGHQHQHQHGHQHPQQHYYAGPIPQSQPNPQLQPPQSYYQSVNTLSHSPATQQVSQYSSLPVSNYPYVGPSVAPNSSPYSQQHQHINSQHQVQAQHQHLNSQHQHQHLNHSLAQTAFSNSSNNNMNISSVGDMNMSMYRGAGAGGPVTQTALSSSSHSNQTYDPYAQAQVQAQGGQGQYSLYNNLNAVPVPGYNMSMSQGAQGQGQVQVQGQVSQDMQPGSSSQRGPEGGNLFVSGIPPSMNEQELYSLFKPFAANNGDLLAVKINYQRAYGFVSFASPSSAAAAMSSLDGILIGDRKISVKLKTERPRPY